MSEAFESRSFWSKFSNEPAQPASSLLRYESGGILVYDCKARYPNQPAETYTFEPVRLPKDAEALHDFGEC